MFICDRVMSLVAASLYRLFVILTLLVELLSRRPVDAVPLHTTCFQGYFNTLRCSPFISWFTTFIVSNCESKCKATGKHKHGACVRRPKRCLVGEKMLYVCECT